MPSQRSYEAVSASPVAAMANRSTSGIRSEPERWVDSRPMSFMRLQIAMARPTMSRIEVRSRMWKMAKPLPASIGKVTIGKPKNHAL